MALTTAERQARYRKRLKQRASLDSLGEQAARAADLAVTALWNYLNRPDDLGRFDAMLDNIPDLETFRLSIAQRDDGLVEWCRELLSHPEDMVVEEARAMRVVVDAADALALVAYRPAKAKKDKKR